MLFTSVATIFSLVSLTVAQNSATTGSPSIPTCVSGCFASSSGTSGCASQSDLSCLCKSNDFIKALSTCFQTTCTSAADAAYGTQFGIQTCLAVGVTVSAPGPSSAATSSAAFVRSSAGIITPASASTASGVIPAAPKTTSGSNSLSIGSTLLVTALVAVFTL